LLALELRFRRRWRKVPSLLLVLKAGALVGAIAKRLVAGVPATAKRERFPSAQAVRLAVHIDKFDFAFDAQGTIVPDGNLRGWH
jgi:hypothetical protein